MPHDLVPYIRDIPALKSPLDLMPKPPASLDLQENIRWSPGSLNSSSQIFVVFVSAVLPQSWSNVMVSPAMSSDTRKFPDHLYVPIHEVVMRASVAVFLLCALSLVTTLLTGFNLVHPLFAMFFAIAALGFFLMGKMFRALQRTT